MNNNHGYSGFPSNSSSFSSFSSQYASTPTNNNARFQRPRFAYAGPPSYPRPRSSASKPNPEPYPENYNNESYYESYDDEYDSNYSRGYMDSMRNNYGDSRLPLNQSMNQSRDSFDDSSAYITCNESFYESPLRPDYDRYDSNNSTYGSSIRGGHSSFSNLNHARRLDSALNANVGGPAMYNNNINKVGSTDSLFRRITGTFATSTGVNTRGNRGGQNRGIARGRFQKKRGSTRGGGSQIPYAGMASKGQSNLKCVVCSINFTSQVPLDMHLRGSKHAKKLKILSALNCIQGQIDQVKEVERPDGKKFYCELCDVIANSSLQLQMHLDGAKHKSKLPQPAEAKEESEETPNSNNQEAELNGKSNGGGVRRPAPADFSEPQPTKMTKFSCDICNIIVNSDMQLQQHLLSKKHKAKVEGKPIFNKRRGFGKRDGDSAKRNVEQGVDIEQSGNVATVETKPKETKSVIGVKTLESSFVKSDSNL